MKDRFWGGVLLISGTSIGAGMLGIPLPTSASGFIYSAIVMIAIWFFMLVTALLFLEVNLAFPGETNMITMSKKILGPIGKAICWVVYLLLLYSLTAAYISSSSVFFLKIMKGLFSENTPEWLGPLPLLIIFGVFVYLGTKSVDIINRFLMAGLVVAYLLLVIFIPSHIHAEYLLHFDLKPIVLGIPIILTSFGYHVIIPSLTAYMRHNVKRLKKMIIVGSLIPLFVYLIWQFLFLGAVPIAILIDAYVNSQIAAIPLMQVVNNSWVISAASSFSFFAIVTSFLGISMSLASFLRDGLKIKKTSSGRLLACVLTYLPPLIFVYSYKRGFIIALQYAAIFVAILLAIYPALMTLKLPNYRGYFNTVPGKGIIFAVILVAAVIAVLGFLDGTGYLSNLINDYK